MLQSDQAADTTQEGWEDGGRGIIYIGRGRQDARKPTNRDHRATSRRGVCRGRGRAAEDVLEARRPRCAPPGWGESNPHQEFLTIDRTKSAVHLPGGGGSRNLDNGAPSGGDRQNKGDRVRPRRRGQGRRGYGRVVFRGQCLPEDLIEYGMIPGVHFGPACPVNERLVHQR